MTWENDQEFERRYWGTCQNTYGEETKQLVYARLMGLVASHDGNSPFSFDMQGKSVMDFGAGPCSLLLKCRNVKGTTMDPCNYPDWVRGRYYEAHINPGMSPAEHIKKGSYDEVWIYNVLQHTQDPEQIIKNAKAIAPVLRIFEWIDIPAHEGHPHMLTEELLNKWIDGKGSTGFLNGEGECYGRYYAGAFIKDKRA